MPVIDENGDIGYYEWEYPREIEWLGIQRSHYREPIPNRNKMNLREYVEALLTESV